MRERVHRPWMGREARYGVGRRDPVRFGGSDKSPLKCFVREQAREFRDTYLGIQ